MHLGKPIPLAFLLVATFGTLQPSSVLASAAIDAASPSIGCGASSADFYRNVAPGTGGCDAAGAPVLDLAAATYGLIPTDDTDGASNGEQNPNSAHILLFSVDRGAVGAAGFSVNFQAGRGQAAGDVFRSSVAPAPTGAFFGGACAGAAPIGVGNTLHNNQADHNFVPTIGPGVAYFGALDEMNALEIGGFDTTGDNVHDLPVYFTLNRFSPSLGASSPADIFLTPVGSPVGVFAPQITLGLQVGDNVDALALWDRGVAGTREPVLDLAIFSLDPNSPSLAGLDGIWGTVDDFYPGDVLVTDFRGFFCVYVQHLNLGLLSSDNLDALDVILVP